MKIFILNIVLFLPLALISCSVTSADNNFNDPDQEFLSRATSIMDSVYVRFGIPGSQLLRENYPFDNGYKASYLASNEQASSHNDYSYLWPFSGTMSAFSSLYEVTGDSAYLNIINDKVLPGLKQYFDSSRLPAAYSSYVTTSALSDRFYDDNIWLGIDFSNLYLASKHPDFIDKAKNIWTFIESGTDNRLGGGIYWCEQNKDSKNTCSNAPGTVFALKLFKATGDSAYLEKGKKLYAWTKKNLQDTTDFMYFDNIKLDGNIGKAKYAYNSGQMMQAAVLLYNESGDSLYLKDARNIASSAFKHFFNGGIAQDSIGKFKLLNKGNIWFTAIMMRGFNELHKSDGDTEYMDAFVRNLNYAWNFMRDSNTGLFNEDWSGSELKEQKWLLTQGAMAEMYAIAADYISRKNNIIRK